MSPNSRHIVNMVQTLHDSIETYALKCIKFLVYAPNIPISEKILKCEMILTST